MFRQILVTVDLGDPELAKPSIETAVALARPSGGHLRLLNVMPPMPTKLAEYVPADFDAQQRRSAEEALTIIAQESGLDPAHVSSTVRQGGVHHEVLEEAKETNADLIVMSSHLSATRGHSLGSNAAHVVRYAKCSVLVVRQ
jgi:nucleotide-binding universal stress UspA family protein